MKAYRVFNHVQYEGDFDIRYFETEGQAIAEVQRRFKEDRAVDMGWEQPQWEEIEIEEVSV